MSNTPHTPGSWQPPAAPISADGQPFAAARPKRPGGVVASSVMSYVGGGSLVLLGLVILVGSVSSSFVRGVADGLALGDSSPGALLGAVLVMGGLLLAIGAVVVVLAVFAQRGRGGARIALTALGALHAVGTLASVFTGAPEGLVSVLYVGIAVVLLWVGGANAWYAATRAARRARR